MEENKNKEVQQTSKKEKVEAVHFVNEGYETPVGNNIQPRYKRVYDEELKKSVVKQVGTINIYEEIQASSSLTDQMLLRRQAIASGVAIPGSGDEIYGFDTGLIPTDIHEAYHRANSFEDRFMKLSEEVRSVVFHNDPQAYVDSVVDQTIGKKIVDFYQAKAKAEAEAAAAKGE